MILSDNTDQNDHKPDFSDIDSIEKAVNMSKDNLLEPLYMMPLRFGGKAAAENTLYVPIGVSQIKESIDNIVEELLIDKLVSGYKCDIKYKEKSVIPSEIKIVASDSEGTEVFAPVINIW